MRKATDLFSRITETLCMTTPFAAKVVKGVVMGLMMATSGVACGDNVTIKKLWEDYSAAEKKDLPKTAIAILHHIQDKAEQRKSYGDLLYAMIKEYHCQENISPDSAKAARERLLAREKQWRGGNEVLATLCQTVMYKEQGAPPIDSLLASKDAEAYTKRNGVADYKPLVEMGADGHYLGDNLISLIALHTGQQRTLYEYYASAGDRKAACIAAALWMTREGTVQQVDSLISIYQDLPECGALAFRKMLKMRKEQTEKRIVWIDEALRRWPKWKENSQLRNERDMLTCPNIEAATQQRVVTTDTDVMLKLKNLRNVKGVKVTLRRIDKKAKTGYGVTRHYEKAIALKNDYEMVEDSLSLGRLPLGTWELTVSDTEGKVMSAKKTLSVSDLMLVSLPLTKGQIRLVVVNAITGQPVPGATLYVQRNNGEAKERLAETDGAGEYLWQSWKRDVMLFATKGDDTAMQPLWAYKPYSSGMEKGVKKYCNLYTDRAIYRPGQTVKAALTHYSLSQGKELNAVNGDTLTVTLRDAQHKEVEKKQVVTDAYGAASVEFLLPSAGRNGSWSINTEYGSQWIKVEEYKRPTFDVTLEKPAMAYHSGDTVVVKGTARTYSGVPVTGAKVAYTVERNKQWWWRSIGSADEQLLTDTVMTAADGTFSIRMPMIMPSGDNKIMPMFYRIDAAVSVTDNAGESHNATLSLPLSNREAYLSCLIPQQMLADSAMTVTPWRRNAAGTEIEGNVRMLLDGVEQGVAEANKPYVLARNIASGEHTLMAICEGDTVKSTFVAFRKSDERPMKYTHQWCYQSANQFPEDGGEVWIQVGSSDNDVHALYAVLAGDSVIRQGTVRLSNENITRTLSYNEAYGDGLTIALAWVKEGTVYSKEITIRRPLPEKRLNMEWTTFRDRLEPGQKEQWAVRVTAPDGTPAKARMVAVLYDKSLEQLAKHRWSFEDRRFLRPSYAAWRAPYVSGLWLRARQSYKEQPPYWLRFAEFAEDASMSWMGKVFDCVEFATSSNTRIGAMRLGEVPAVAKQMAMAKRSAAVKTEDLVGRIGGLDIASGSVEATASADDEAADEAQDVPLRSDFAETAFFMPAVMTDEKGIATMTFTLPESVTTWRFMALAHNDAMCNATLVADAVAQKPLMVQPNMPRFLRYGDNATVATTVANLSDKEQNVKVTLTVLDAQTERKVLSQTRKAVVKSGETGVVTFPVDATKMPEGAYIFRFTAQGAGHTDGEQQCITVLSDEETVTATAAYTFTEPTDTVLSFADMIPAEVRKAHLKVDYVDNPAWLMMEALPEMVEPKGQNAISLSTALYANRVAASLNWSEDKSGDILTALQQLQNSDGSFSWWQGMEGSVYMTSAVITTLARLNSLCGKQADTRQLLDKAFRYMQGQMDKDVSWMKQREKQGSVSITHTQLYWLYALTLEGRKGGASARYLLSKVEADAAKSDMATKAVAAIVLNGNGRKADARTFVEAIKQHTVYRKDVGRYFDSPRAAYSWCDYRIPTQTLAIEALREVTPKDRQTVAEMQRWLLSSKRTQDWGSPYNAVNAVHAFFGGDRAVLKYEKGKQVLADKEVTPRDATVTLRKQSDCESWAAAYVTFRQKAEAVKDVATGLSVKREVLKNGVPATAGNVKVGDKVTVRITVTADRDYDFVSITDNKAACLEPVAAISGYSNGCYREVKDAATAFHFCQMAKGTHVVQADYYVDRVGEYLSGIVTAECAYANEFRGTQGAYHIQIKK